jgi:hypothetical protein
MALWGISTTTETAANNYAIPKHLSENDRNNTPWNCFADVRGWVYRRYGTNEHSGLSSSYYDEVLVPVAGLNSTSTGGEVGATGIGTAGPVAVFFEDPNRSSRISIGGGATTGISTNNSAYVHVVFNEFVFAGAGATMRIRTFDANDANESTAIVAYASSAGVSTQFAWSSTAALHGSPDVFVNYNGQITNRVSFAFTSPSTLLTANVNFLTTGITTAVGAAATVIWVDSVAGVAVGSSVRVGATTITSAPVVSIGDTFVRIAPANAISGTIAAGTAVTFSTFTRATKLSIDLTRGFIGLVTDGSNSVGVISSFTSQFGDVILRNVGGAGTTGSVGIGTTTLTTVA